MTSRRRVLSGIGVCLAGAHVASRRVSAESTTVRGTIESAVGSPLDGSEIEFFSPDINDFTKTRIEDGMFEATVEAGATYVLTFYHIDGTGSYQTDADGVPLLYGLADDVEVTADTTDIGSYEMPEGHRTKIKFENLDGNPVQRLDVGFRTTTGGGTGGGQFTTNAAGYVYGDEETNPGVELAGEVGIELNVPGEEGGSQVDQFDVTEAREVTIPLRDPASYGGIVVESDDSTTETPGPSDTTGGTTQEAADTPDPAADVTDGASSDHRGFLTNDPDSSLSFLDDPVSLTWAGIGVSIAGIVAQLFGRQS